MTLFKALFETAPDAMIVVGHDGVIVLANPQADHLFGYEAGELRGLPVETLLPEPLRHRHTQHRARYMALPRVRPMGAGHELTGLRRDGQVFPVEIGLSPIQDGERRLYAACIRDISETQRARQALARSRYDVLMAQASRLLLESPSLDVAVDSIAALVASVLHSEAALILFRDAFGAELHLRAAIGVTDALVQRLIRRITTEHWMERTSSTNSGPTLLSQLAQGARAVLHGTAFHDAVIVLLPDRHGPMGMLVVPARETDSFGHDLLHFLQSIANMLAAAVQRSRSEEQLAHAQRLEAIGKLTGGIAHDFNNMLTVISGNLQLLGMSLSPDSSEGEILDSAARATERCATLTGKLLSFASRRRLSPQMIKPAQALNDLREMLARTLGEGIRVTTECSRHVPQIQVDPAEFDTALVNLAVNARDAMPRGGQLSLTVDIECIDATLASTKVPMGTFVVFRVEDTGMGMMPEVQARALEPFFTTKEPGKGSGVGLSMVYGFVKQSGGHLVIDSQLGYGTRVSLYFPVVDDATLREPTASGAAIHKGQETILVVEDEPEVRAIALAFLHSLGYATRDADSALGALRQLDEHGEICLLFSDIVLGKGMTGAELMKAARELRPDLPVLLTSGYERDSLDTSALATQGVDLLRKPYRIEQLSDALHRVLAPRRPNTEDDRARSDMPPGPPSGA